MNIKEILRENIDKIHTTEMGVLRIKRNLKIEVDDVVDYCKKMIMDKQCVVEKQGKNYYCYLGKVKLTINSYSYTIITAHLLKVATC